MPVEHLHPLIDHTSDSQLIFQAASCDSQVATLHNFEETARGSEGHRCRRHRETLSRTYDLTENKSKPQLHFFSVRCQPVRGVSAWRTHCKGSPR